MTEQLTKQMATLELDRDVADSIKLGIDNGIKSKEQDGWTLQTVVFPNGAYADLMVWEENLERWIEMWFYDTDGEFFEEQTLEARTAFEGTYTFTDTVANTVYEVKVAIR